MFDLLFSEKIHGHATILFLSNPVHYNYRGQVFFEKMMKNTTHLKQETWIQRKESGIKPQSMNTEGRGHYSNTKSNHLEKPLQLISWIWNWLGKFNWVGCSTVTLNQLQEGAMVTIPCLDTNKSIHQKQTMVK